MTMAPGAGARYKGSWVGLPGGAWQNRRPSLRFVIVEYSYRAGRRMY